MKIFRLLSIAVFAWVVLVPATAQYSADPLNPIYHWFDLWEGRGYLRDMPVFRPYPENVLVRALERVVVVGDQESRSEAARFLRQLDENIEMEWSIVQETRVFNDEIALKAGAGLSVHGRLSEMITASGSITGVLLDDDEANLYPRGRRTDWDIMDDWSSVPLFGRDVASLSQVNSSFAWGSDSLYLHAGIMRRSFGPLHDDGVVLSPYARQAPGMVATWQNGRFRWSAGLFSMTATQLIHELTPFNEPNIDVVAPPGADLLYDPEEYPGKYVFIQDFRFAVTPWLTMAFFESATWGPRFELAYLLPAKWAFHAQGSISFADSSKMGISAELRPRSDLQIPFVLYVDDASFNELVRFKFDTKLKLAVHTAVIWTPTLPLVRRVSLDYLALLPYMYTHDGAGGVYALEPIYTNYTHQRESLGPGLEPNSDRVTFSATFQPLARLDAKVSGRLIRHGNASDEVARIGAWNHNGTIWDDGRYYRFRVDEDLYVRRGGLSFQEELRFLNQDHIEHTWQTGIDLAYRLPVRDSRRIGFTVEAGYHFEYVAGPLQFEPTGETIQFRDEDTETVIYRSVPGEDQVNHYWNLRFRVMY